MTKRIMRNTVLNKIWIQMKSRIIKEITVYTRWKMLMSNTAVTIKQTIYSEWRCLREPSSFLFPYFFLLFLFSLFFHFSYFHLCSSFLWFLFSIALLSSNDVCPFKSDYMNLQISNKFNIVGPNNYPEKVIGFPAPSNTIHPPIYL